MKNHITSDIICEDLSELENLISESGIPFNQLVELHQEEDWDYVRFELWNDTGRIIIFPARRDADQRIDQCGLSITCNEVENIIHEATFNDIPESEYLEIESSITKRITNLIAKSGPMFGNGTISVYEYDEDLVFST